MAKKKINIPHTSDGFSRTLDKMISKGVSTREDAYKFATLMYKSIQFELEKLESSADPFSQELINRYKELEAKWAAKLQYASEHYFEPIK